MKLKKMFLRMTLGAVIAATFASVPLAHQMRQAEYQPPLSAVQIASQVVPNEYQPPLS